MLKLAIGSQRTQQLPSVNRSAEAAKSAALTGSPNFLKGCQENGTFSSESQNMPCIRIIWSPEACSSVAQRGGQTSSCGHAVPSRRAIFGGQGCVQRSRMQIFRCNERDTAASNSLDQIMANEASDTAKIGFVATVSPSLGWKTP